MDLRGVDKVETGASVARGIRRFGLRRLRLITGLTLFTYVTTHLTNHALGNISIDAMEAGLLVQKWIWQGILGTTALYFALGTHYALGLWALYERRHFGWTRVEILQLALGLSIPFLLMNHVFVTRMALTQFGLQKGYAQELYSFWWAAPELGVLQVSVLIVAWFHGCIGVYLWLRLKPWFAAARQCLFVAALLLPVLALLGFYQGGKFIRVAVHDPVWRAANLGPTQIGRPAENTMLLWERNASLQTALGLLGLVFLARGFRTLRERHAGTVRITYPGGRVSRVPAGFSVLEASKAARIPHANVCGGRARCSTCRVRVVGNETNIPPPQEIELSVLARVGMAPPIRLACQLRPLADIAVVPLLSPDVTAANLRPRNLPRTGEERFVVVLTVDMRDSTRLAETRLPFDTVFIVDRFIGALGAAITQAGGQATAFTGDGLMATFGLACDPDRACRQAIAALALIGRNVANLNAALAAELTVPIRYGIGIHGSTAIVGEIGYAETRNFTTLGEAANLATRLENLCKPFGCVAVVSEAVCRRAGIPDGVLVQRDVEIRGRDEPLIVYTIDDLAAIDRFTPA